MKAIEALRDLVVLYKGSKFFKNGAYKVLSGKIYPRSTYYATFKTYDLYRHEPDVILLTEKEETLYLYRIEH